MITVDHLVTPLLAGTAKKVKATAQRWVRAVIDARMRRIQHEIEFHRVLHDYRRVHGMPLLSQEDRLGRL